MKKISLLVVVLILIGGGYALVQYLALDSETIPPSVVEETSESVEYEIVEVVSGLDVPWAIAFTSPTRMLVTERSGTIRAVLDGILQPEPLITLSDVSSVDEE